MTKNIIIGISGLQFTGEENADSLEVIASGEYYLKNGRHYVKYEEVIEGFPGKNQNLVKIGPGKIEVTKKGITNVHMVFEENRRNVSCYSTPFGNLMVGIEGGPVTIEETGHRLDVRAKYALEINYEHIADCEIRIRIQSKEAGEFSFRNI